MITRRTLEGIEVLLARLAARAVKVGVDLGHRAGIVDVGG